MSKRVIINPIEGAERIQIEISYEKTPIAYKHRVKMLMAGGMSKHDAHIYAKGKVECEIYCDECGGIFAIELGSANQHQIRSPYTGLPCINPYEKEDEDEEIAMGGGVDCDWDNHNCENRDDIDDGFPREIDENGKWFGFPEEN